MKIYYDLHIHSCLSPCADDDMTPNNVINMAKLKGLDLISITDHNCTLNLKEFVKVAKKLDMILIPGVEVETNEEIHILLYFKDYSIVDEFQKILDKELPYLRLNQDIYGRQLLADENDNIINDYDKLLLQPLNLNLIEVYEISKFYDMVFIPAHINRQSYGILGRLGSLPEELSEINIFEISKYSEIEYLNIIKDKSNYIFLHSSDAHHLWEINEREFFIESDILYTIFFK